MHTNASTHIQTSSNITPTLIAADDQVEEKGYSVMVERKRKLLFVGTSMFAGLCDFFRHDDCEFLVKRGWTIVDLVELAFDVDFNKYSGVVFMGGTNDVQNRGFDLNDLVGHLRDLCNEFQHFPIPLYFLDTPPLVSNFWNFRARSLNKAKKILSMRYRNCFYMGGFSEFYSCGSRISNLFRDKCHFSGDGLLVFVRFVGRVFGLSFVSPLPVRAPVHSRRYFFNHREFPLLGERLCPQFLCFPPGFPPLSYLFGFAFDTFTSRPSGWSNWR